MSIPDRYRRQSVDVDGASFAVGTWHGTSLPVFALHGVSSNHLLWSWAAKEAPELTIIAPDLRGRGGSLREGPFGLVRHRDDMLALMDTLGLERVVLAGMSMGGFIATAMASLAPDRFSAVVLVDGGLPMPVPEATQKLVVEQLVQRGAANETFSTVAAYTENYLAQLGQDLDRDDPLLEAFMAWNLQPAADGSLAVRMPGEALATDSADVFGGEPVGEWLGSLAMPVHLLHADNPLGSIEATTWAARLPDMAEEHIPGVDHATIVMGERGGKLVAEALRRFAA